MRTLFIITCLANIAFAFSTLPWMPEKVAVHFGLNGAPDGWDSSISNAIAMSTTVGLLAMIFLSISLSMPIMPTFCFNVPNRHYWLNEKKRPQTIRRLRSFLDVTGVGIFLFFLFVQWETFQANQKVPAALNMIEFWTGLGIFFLFIIVESIRLHLVFRLPKEKEE